MWTVWFMEIWHVTHNITAKNVNGYRSCLSTFKNLTYRSNRLPVTILSVAKRGLTALGVFFFQLYGQTNVLLHCIKNELCNFLQLKLQSLIRPCINTDNFTTILSYFVPSQGYGLGRLNSRPIWNPSPNLHQRINPRTLTMWKKEKTKMYKIILKTFCPYKAVLWNDLTLTLPMSLT